MLRKMTQAGLAARAGMAQANLSNIEKGKRDLTVSMLIRIAEALEVRPSELIDAPASSERMVLTRGEIERLAFAVVNPDQKVPRPIRELAALFRILRPGSGVRTGTRTIEQAWASLRGRFTSREIQGIFQRIEDAQLRGHAQKAN